MPQKETQLSPRVLANRRNGALGGKARAKNNSKQQIQMWGSVGGTNTHLIYGKGLKVFMGKQRKTVGRYRTPVEDTIVAKSRRAKLKRKSNDSEKE